MTLWGKNVIWKYWSDTSTRKLNIGTNNDLIIAQRLEDNAVNILEKLQAPALWNKWSSCLLIFKSRGAHLFFFSFVFWLKGHQYNGSIQIWLIPAIQQPTTNNSLLILTVFLLFSNQNPTFLRKVTSSQWIVFNQKVYSKGLGWLNEQKQYSICYNSTVSFYLTINLIKCSKKLFMVHSSIKLCSTAFPSIIYWLNILILNLSVSRAYWIRAGVAIDCIWLSHKKP